MSDVHPKYIKRAILYLDLLGYKEIILKNDQTSRNILQEQIATHENFSREGFIRVSSDNILYRPDATFVSDSMVFGYAYEETKSKNVNPVESLLNVAARIACRYYPNGILFRGAIVIGDMFQDNSNCIGWALCKALNDEKKFWMPAIEINPTIDLSNELHPSLINRITKGKNKEQKDYDIVDTLFIIGSAQQQFGAEGIKDFKEFLSKVAGSIKEKLSDNELRAQDKWQWFQSYYNESLKKLEAAFPKSYKNLESQYRC